MAEHMSKHMSERMSERILSLWLQVKKYQPIGMAFVTFEDRSIARKMRALHWLPSRYRAKVPALL